MKMTRHASRFVCALVALYTAAASTAAAQSAASPVAGPATEQVIRSSYVLGPDDEVIIQARDVPEISGKAQRIGIDGDLRLPMVGRIDAAGMTIPRLEAEIASRLKVYIREPDVAVAISEFRSQPVSVIGAVASPGVHQLRGRKTLIEMLSLAGGVSPDAGPTARVTRRREFGTIDVSDAAPDTSGAFTVVEIDVKALLDARTPERNIAIRPHDVISVPRAELVYVIGEVGKPGSVALNRASSISVMEAVSASGGALRTARRGKTRVLRKLDGVAERREIPVNLTDIMAGKAQDFRLLPGDIVVVPDSTGRRISTRVLEAALQVGIFAGVR